VTDNTLAYYRTEIIMARATSLAFKYYTRVEVTANDEHSSLLRNRNNYGYEKFYDAKTKVFVVKLLTIVINSLS